MAIDRDVIRRLSMQMESRGFDKAAADLGKLVDAQGRLIDSSGAVAVASDKASTGLLSAYSKAERLERTLIPAAKQAYELSRALSTIQAPGAEKLGMERLNAVMNAAIAKTDEYKNAQREAAAEQERIDRALVASTERRQKKLAEYAAYEERIAQMRHEQASQLSGAQIREVTGVDRVPATQRGATTSALADMMRELEAKEKEQEAIQKARGEQVGQAFAQGLSDRLRIGVRAIDMGATFSALQEQFDREETVAKARVQSFVDILNFNTGVSRPSAASAGASGSALIEREQELMALEKQAHAVLEAIDPIEQANKRLQSEQALYNRMAKEGLITEKQLLAAREMAESKHSIVTRGLGTDATANNLRLASHQWTNLGFQINDVATMLASGSSPFQVMATQGGQVYQILSGARGGLVGGMQALGAALMSAKAAAIGTVGVLLAGGAAVAYSWSSYIKDIKELDRSLTGVGRGTQATSSQIVALAEAAGAASGLSTRSAREMMTTYAGTGKIAVDLFDDLARVQKDYAATTGQDVADATKELAQAFADPSRGADLLIGKLNNLDDTQLQMIRNMQASGNSTGAQRMLFDSLNGTLVKHETQLTMIGRAWEAIKEAASDTLDSITRTIEPSLQAQADSAREVFERERQNLRSRASSGRDVSTRDMARVQDLYRDAIDKDFANRNEQIMREIQAQDAAAKSLSRTVGEINRGLDPMGNEIQETENKLASVRKLLANETGLIKVEELEKAQRSAGLLAGKLENLREEMEKAGATQAFNTLTDANFAAASAGLDSYAMTLAQINQQFDMMVRSAKGAQSQIDAFEEARRKTLQAATAAAAKSAIQNVLPELQQFENLQSQQKAVGDALRSGTLEQLGLSAAEAETAISRLGVMMSRIRPAAQQLIEQNTLELRMIEARTLAERAQIEMIRTYNDVLRESGDAAKAAVAAEGARNRMVAEANRQAQDSLRSAQDEAGLVGLKPYQRAQQELANRMRDQRERLSAGTSPISVPTGHTNPASIPRATGLDTSFSGALARMMQAIPGISVTSGYRSPERQAELFGQAVAKYGSEAAARRWVAPPGRSQHNHGLAADLRFATPDARAEAHRRAGEFGLRFPMGHEPWHIEPVGGRNRRALGAVPGRLFPQQPTADPLVDQEAVTRSSTLLREYSEGPLRQANEQLDAQVALLRRQQETFGMSTAKIVEAAEAQRLLNEYEAAGVTVTQEMQNGIAAYAQRAGQAAEETERLASQQQAIEQFGDIGKNALKGFLADLRAGKSGAEALENALMKVADRLLDMAIEGLFSSKAGGNPIQALISGLTGGLGGGAPASPVGIYHSGGRVGSPSEMRYVHPAYFENAPRFHSGTLRPDERASILQTGEVVLSRDDVAQASKRGAQQAQGGATVVQPVVNVIGAPSQPEVRQGSNGSVDIVFEQVESGLAERANRGRGSLVKAVSQRQNGTALIG